MIYVCFLGMMFSGLAMQLWQPYMISLVEVTLGIENYILPIGIVVLASAVLSVLAGKVMDRFGKEKFYYPVAILQVLGGLIAYSIKFVGHAMPLLCVGARASWPATSPWRGCSLPRRVTIRPPGAQARRRA